MTRVRSAALALTAAVVFSGCAADASNAALPPDAAAGRDLFRGSGCAACHGGNGQGGVGPALVGLARSEVEVEYDGPDGDEVTEIIVADREYLVESIAEPSARRHTGYRLPMPTNGLEPDEIESIVDWIEAIAEPADSTEGAAP